MAVIVALASSTVSALGSDFFALGVRMVLSASLVSTPSRSTRACCAGCQGKRVNPPTPLTDLRETTN